MPFSRLLLMGANTRKYIVGKRHQDKVELKPKEALVSQASPHSDELALFFQIDEEKMRLGLRMIGDGVKCCDGLIFYSKDGQREKVICLVEMKSTNIREAAAQIGETRKHLEQMLKSEGCDDYMQDIIWKACLYSSSSALNQSEVVKRELMKKYSFKEEHIRILNMHNNDIGPLLRGEMSTEKTKSPKKMKRRS